MWGACGEFSGSSRLALGRGEEFEKTVGYVTKPGIVASQRILLVAMILVNNMPSRPGIRDKLAQAMRRKAVESCPQWLR